MFVRVPVAYRSTVVYKAGRKDYDHLFAEFVEVHVAEVDAADAPVALSWTTSPREDLDGVRQTRWYDGSHWVPSATKSSFNDPVRPLDFATMARRMVQGEDRTLSVGPSHVVRDFQAGTYKSLDESDVRQVKIDGRTSAIEQAHSNASNAMLIDGMVWTRTAEPVYAVRPGGNIVWVEVVEADSRKFADGGSLKRANSFRVDRWDDVVDHCAQKFPRCEIHRNATVDVLMPESVRHDDETPALIEDATTAFRWTGKEEVMLMPVTGLVAWAGMRDALLATAHDRSEEACSRVVDALRAFDREVHEEGSWQSDSVARMLARWDLRPMPGHDPEAAPVIRAA